MLRITRKQNGGVVFKVSGELNSENLPEMKASIEKEESTSRIVLDLNDVTSADSEAVSFLAKCEASAIELNPCGSYLRGRIKRQRLKGDFQRR